VPQADHQIFSMFPLAAPRVQVLDITGAPHRSAPSGQKELSRWCGGLHWGMETDSSPPPSTMTAPDVASVQSCIPVIPSADLKKSLRFWVDGLGLTVDREMRHEGKLIGCMVHNRHLYFWLNQRAGTSVKPENYHGIRLYWAPSDIQQVRERLKQLGYAVSAIEARAYGQTEFFVTDDDGFSHCFGVATKR
jgi:catechol 2,3-dioxygenase-like lactoylglutathione lyase family enzyme